MMNKRGSMFLGIVVTVIIYFMGILFLPFVADNIDTFRVSMTCEDTSISGGNMMACVLGDAMIPYYLWLIVSIVFGVIVGVRK